MPTPITNSANRAANLRSQAAAFRDFTLANAPTEPAALDLWMQHAAGFIFFEKVRAAGLATLEPNAPKEIRAAVELAVDSTVYALMMQIDGVSGGLRGADVEIKLTFGVDLIRDDAVVANVDLRNGDGMCMGFHSWADGDFGTDVLVEK